MLKNVKFSLPRFLYPTVNKKDSKMHTSVATIATERNATKG